MKSIAIKLACVVALATSLSGCIMYVGPHHYDKHRPAPAEKPADTISKDQASSF
jgi:hypothetical protein